MYMYNFINQQIDVTLLLYSKNSKLKNFQHVEKTNIYFIGLIIIMLMSDKNIIFMLFS